MNNKNQNLSSNQMNQNKGNNSILLVIIIILLIVVIALFGYYLFFYEENRNLNNNDNNNDITENKDTDNEKESEKTPDPEKETVTDLSLDNTTVKELSNRVIGLFTNDTTSSFGDYFFKKDKMNMDEELTSMKLTISTWQMVKNTLDGTPSKKKITLPESAVKESYESLFGKDGGYQTINFESSCRVKFSYSNDNYQTQTPDGCGGTAINSTHSRLAYAKQIKSSKVDKIELYEYFYYEDAKEAAINGTDTYYYYSDYNHSNLIIKTGSLDENTVFTKYKDQLGLYKYTFEKDSNGTYVFTSVERVK